MPTYEYECLDGGHHFEEFQSITEPPLTECPECGGRARRLIGAGAGILFKGSGFYQTDYRSASYKKAAKAEASQGGSDSGSSTGEKAKTSSSE